MRKIMALLGLAFSLCACHKPATPELSLEGTWKAADGGQVTNCGTQVPVTVQQLSFELRDAPLLNRAVSSYDFQKSNVTGAVTMELHMENGHPLTVDSGLLVGEIVAGSADRPGPRLQGYILSNEQYGEWISKNKSSIAPPNSGEVDLQITGNAAFGYTLTGEIRSSEACGKFSHLDAVAADLTGQFGRSVPAEWAAKVILQKQ